jgi:quinol monooxygenase YgiN
MSRERQPAVREPAMIILLIEAVVPEMNRARFLERARAQAEASRAEEGCLAFDAYESPWTPGLIRFVELWTSADALAAHRDQPHSKFFREHGRPLADSMTVRKFEAEEQS